MKPGRFQSLATSLYDGHGEPRYREGIIASIEAALESAYQDGRREAWPEARTYAMREVKCAIEGATRSLESRAAVIERDLAEPT